MIIVREKKTRRRRAKAHTQCQITQGSYIIRITWSEQDTRSTNKKPSSETYSVLVLWRRSITLLAIPPGKYTRSVSSLPCPDPAARFGHRDAQHGSLYNSNCYYTGFHAPSNHVRVLELITISADLSLNYSMSRFSKVCAASFYRLRQLRRIRKSPDKIHGYPCACLRDITCWLMRRCLYAMSPQTVINRLQRVMMLPPEFNLSCSDTGKFDRGLKTILHDETSSIGWMLLRGLSTRLVRWCTGVCMDRHIGTSQTTSSQPAASDAVPRRRRLRSVNLNRLIVPRCRLSTYGCRAFDSLELAARWT